MLRPEPNEASIEAWLAGELSPDEAERLERFFDEDSGDAGKAESVDESDLFHGLSVEDDPAVVAMVARVKSGLDCEPLSPGKDSWKHVLSESSEPGLLGTLGEYEVVEVIAVGGMAMVLKGYDPELKRFAALKVLSPEMAANATARERFLREARAAARLEHENVLPVYGVYDEGVPWFAMRYVAGETLQERLDSGEAFSPDKLKSIGLQMAAALEAAHSGGIVHRDIKPANVLFDEEGERLWVCDFGIARCSEDPSLTYPGAIAGTPRFMSPEQAAGEEVDFRSDYFSLGAVLFLCATGEHVAGGATTLSVLSELREERFFDWVEQALRPWPVWLRRLILALLRPEPEKRLTSPEVIREAIENEEFHLLSARERRRRRRVRVFATAILLALGFVLALQFPAAKAGVNRVLSYIRGDEFRIENRFGVYPDFKAAVAASVDGDTLVLPGGKPILVDDIVIPSGKRLTLTSSEGGERAKLTTVLTGGPGITVRSGLSVRGVDFFLNSDRDGKGILIFEGTSGELVDCGFFCDREVEDSYRDTKGRAVEVRDGADVRVEACRFEVSETNAITMGGRSGAVSIVDSDVNAFFAVNLIAGDLSEERFRIEARNSRIEAECFIKSSTPGVPYTEVKSENCGFQMGLAYCWFQTTDADPVLERFRIETVNPASIRGEFSVRIGERAHRYAELCVLDPALFAEERPEPGFVENTVSGKRFRDLAAAVSDCGSGEELRVSGTVVATREVMTNSGMEFIMKGVSGTNPTIVAGHAVHHALFVLGPGKVSGVHFVRHAPISVSLPVVGILSPGGEAVFENCTFESIPGEEEDPDTGTGLSITNTPSATIRGCTFRCGRDVYVAFLRGKATRSRIRFSECFFSGDTAIHFAPRIRDVSLTLGADRCLFSTRHFLEEYRDGERSDVHVEMYDTALDISDSYLNFVESSRDEIGSFFSMAGTGNVFRPEVKVIEGIEEYSNLLQFLRLLPQPEKWEGEPGIVVGRELLSNPVTVREAIDVIDGNVYPEYLNLLRMLEKETVSR